VKADKPIRVLLADDFGVVRHGLSVLMETIPDVELVGQAEDGEQAIQKCGELDPDVVLIDLKMPTMDGIQAMRKIHELYPHINMIVLTSFQDNQLVREALQAGAIGYLMKDGSVDTVIAAIRAAQEGKHTLSEEATKALIDISVNAPEQGKEHRTYNLSERELQVLECIVEGMTNREIAEKLIVSRSTVKFHVSSILAKLNVTSRTEATTLAIRSGLIELF